MEIQTWIYIIIAVAVLLRNLLKKPDAQPQGQPEARPDRPVRYDEKPPMEKPKPMTFEELLQEITEGKQRRTAEVPSSQPEAEYVDYDDTIEPEEKSLEQVAPREYRQEERSYETYERVGKEAAERASLEETMRVEHTNVEFGKFKTFEQQKKRSLIDEYQLNLSDRRNLKKAFVLSEILNRKY